MKLTVNTNHLALIDRIVDAGVIGKTREAVLNSAVIEHARYLLAGGSPFKAWQPGLVEVDTPFYGQIRWGGVPRPIGLQRSKCSINMGA